MGGVISLQHGSQEHQRQHHVRLRKISATELSSIEDTCNEWLVTIKNIKSGEMGNEINAYLHMRLIETVQKFQDFFEPSLMEPQGRSQQQGGGQQYGGDRQRPHGQPPQRPPAPPSGGHHGHPEMHLQVKLPPSDQLPDHRKLTQENELDEERKANNAALKSLAEMNENLKKKVEKQEEEKRQLLTRLSAVVGEKLCHNNPDIADLSDPNRPTKIGEQFSELYDNEWTNAFEELEEAGYTEKEAIDTLRLTLESTYSFCREKSESLISSVETAALNLFTDETKPRPKSLTMCDRQLSPAMVNREVSEINVEKFKLQARWKPREGHKKKMEQTLAKPQSKKDYNIEGKLKQLRKEVGLAMIPMVQKAYLKEMWDASEHLALLKPYIRKCLRICWFMVIQTPPMCIELGDLHGQRFEKERFRSYTREGKQIDYVVWPPLRLHESGALVTKGVAQGTRPGSPGTSNA